MRNRKQQPTRTLPAPTGHLVSTWAQAAGLGRSTYYNLPNDAKPQSVLIGTRRVIIESPSEWLQRMVERGGVRIPQRKSA